MGKNGELGPASAVIMAGGRSSRMGRDKALLPWDDTCMLGQVLRVVQGEFAHVSLSVRGPEAYEAFDLPIVRDSEPGTGPLCGLTSALAAAETDWVFVTACDMPFPDTGLWHALAASATAEADAIVPRTAPGLEPLCAFYHRRCLEPFRARLAAGGLAIYAALADLTLVEVEATAWDRQGKPSPFANANTPDEFTALRAFARDALTDTLGDVRVRAKLWLERDGDMVFGGGRTDLLRHIERTGSINRAASEMHMSYRRALGRIQQMEATLGYALVERRTGGRSGGGSRLTAQARELLRRFEALEADLDSFVSTRFASVFEESPA